MPHRLFSGICRSSITVEVSPMSSFGFNAQPRAQHHWRASSDADKLVHRASGKLLARIERVPDREDLWRIQEPPGFIGEFSRMDARLHAQNLARKRVRAA
jgi:hypothetical protein